MSKIQLATANAFSRGGIRDWKIRENITNKELWDFSSGTLEYVSDKGIMDILHFARKYELIAFNTGIQFGKEEQRKVSKTIIDNLNENIEELLFRNNELATALDKELNKTK